jgi:hypothetical protein
MSQTAVRQVTANLGGWPFSTVRYETPPCPLVRARRVIPVERYNFTRRPRNAYCSEFGESGLEPRSVTRLATRHLVFGVSETKWESRKMTSRPIRTGFDSAR